MESCSVDKVIRNSLFLLCCLIWLTLKEASHEEFRQPQERPIGKELSEAMTILIASHMAVTLGLPAQVNLSDNGPSSTF